MAFVEHPKQSRPWKNAATVAGFVVFTGVWVWAARLLEVDWLLGVPFIAAIPIGFYFFRLRRCPECDGRLSSWDEMRDDTTVYRIMSRCEICQIDWDTGFRGDTRYRD